MALSVRLYRPEAESEQDRRMQGLTKDVSWTGMRATSPNLSRRPSGLLVRNGDGVAKAWASGQLIWQEPPDRAGHCYCGIHFHALSRGAFRVLQALLPAGE